ncbi:MAG TPA: hypothetical protein PLQ76_04490, partial [bacterium]|nr:hypothetical protein [bacterium]
MIGPESKNPVKFKPFFTVSFFLFWFFFYSIFSSGMPPNGDPVNYFLLARNIVLHGSFGMERSEVVPLDEGPDGAFYSKFGLGQSLLEVPFYAAANAIVPGRDAEPYPYAFHYFVASLSVPFVCALLCAAFLFLCVERGYPRRVCMAATAVLGLATMVWPYSKTGFSEPLQAALLCGAVLYAFRSAKNASAALSAGALAGLL